MFCASSNKKKGFSIGCGLRTNPFSVISTPRVGTCQNIESGRSNADRDSRHAQFIPLGVKIARSHPFVSESVGRTTSYHAFSFNILASSNTAPLKVNPLAWSGSSSVLKIIRPPVWGKRTVGGFWRMSAISPTAFRISSNPIADCSAVGAPHRIVSPMGFRAP